MPSLKNIKFSYSSPPPPCIDPPPPPPPPPSSPHPPCSPCQHKNHVPPPPPAVAPPPPTYFPPPPPTIQPGTIAPPPPSTYCPPPPPTIQPGTIAPPPPLTYFPPPPPTIQPSTIAPPPRVVQPSTNAPPPRSVPNYLPPPIFAPSNPPILSSPPWGYSAPSIAPLPPPQSSNHIPLMVGTSLGGLFFLSFLVIGINYFYANKLAVPKSGGQELGPRPSRGDGGVRTTAAVPHGGGTASQLKVDNSMDAAGPTAEDIVDQGTSVPPLEKGKQLAPPSSEHKPVGDSGDPTPGKEQPPEDSQSSEKEKEREREKKAKTDEVIKSLKETKTLLTGLLQMKKLEHNELMAAHSITNKKLDPVPETLDRFQQDKAEIMPTTSSASKNTDVENKTSINDSAEKQEIVGDGDDDDDDDDDDAPLEDQVPEKNDVNDDKAGEVGLQENKEESEGTRSEEKTAPIAKKKKKLSRKKQPNSNRPLAEMVAKTAQKELNKIGGESEMKDTADEDVDIDDDGVGDDVAAGGDEYKDDADDDLVENKDDGQVPRSVEEKITPLNENEDGSERVETKKHGINRRDKGKKSPMRPATKSVAFMEKVVMEDGDEGKSQSKNADVENDLNKTGAESTEEQEIVGGDDDDDDAPLGDQKENNDVDDEAGEEEKISPADHDERDSPVAKNNKFPRKRQQRAGSNRSSTKKMTSTQKQIVKTVQNELIKIGGEAEKKDNADEDVDIDDDGVGDDVAGGDEYKDDADDDLVENKDDGQATRSEEEKITPLNENEDGSERVEAKKHGINRRDKAKRSPMRPAMKSVAFMEKMAMEDGVDGKSQSKTADVENDLNKTSAESTEEQEIVGGDDDDDDAPLGDQKENDDVDDEAGEEENISPADHDERDSPVAKNNKFPRKRQQPAGSNRSSTKMMTSTQKQMEKTAQNELNKSSGESEKKDTNADDGVADDDDDNDDDDDDDGEVLADLDVMGFVEGMGLSSFKKWITIRKLVKANSRVVQELQKMDEKLRAGRKNRGVGIDEAAKAMSIGSEFMEAGESEEKIADNNDVEGETEKEHEAGEKTGENYEPPLMKRKRHVTQNMKSQKRESKTQSQAEVKRHAVLGQQTVEGEGQGIVNEGDMMEEPDAEGDESYSCVDEEEGMQSADAANTDERDQIMRYPAEGNDEDAVARKIKAGKHKSNPPAKTQSYSAQVESLGEADESFLQELSVAGLDMNKGMQSAEKKRNDVTKRATSKNMKAGKSDHLNRQLQHAEAERSTITHLVKKSSKLYEQEMANNDDDEEKYQQDLEQEIMSLVKGSVARNINRSTKPPLKQPKGKKPTTTATLNTIAQKKGISQLTNLPKLDEDNQDEEIDQPDDGDAVKQEYVADDAAAAEEGQSASTDAASAEEGQSASTI